MSGITRILALMAMFSFSLAQNELYSLEDTYATVYYDLTNSLCGDASKGDPFVANWAVTSGINTGIPFCQGQIAETLNELGTNQIVAMSAVMIKADPSKWCGKEVQITKTDGTLLQFDEGPLFIWDTCDNCSTNPHIDLSAKAFVDLKGGTCAGDNPRGISVKVLDNVIHGSGVSGQGDPPPISSSASSPITSETTSSDTVPTTSFDLTSTGYRDRKTLSTSTDMMVPSSSVVPTPSGSGVVQLSSTVSAGTTGDCTYGAWQCNGLTLQVCNYVSLTELDWETISTCTSTCQITQSGSVDCQ